MTRFSIRTAAAIAVLAASAAPAFAFCGFYVAKADTKLFNKASQVVLVRDGDRTIVTMASDFKGDPKEFAMVVPVPTAIQRGQINVGDKALVEHLDAFTAPRLVEYSTPTHAPWPNRLARMARLPGRQDEPPGGGARQESRRHDRGPLHRGRVRHPDPVGHREPRARDLAAVVRLPHSRRAPRTC